MLMDGQQLMLPGGVMRSTYNASTFTPYDPASVMGDTAPTAPVQPKPKKNNCGVLGQIFAVVIGVVATLATGGALAGAMSPILSGAIAGAAGSIASQTFAVAAGIQDKFSWNAVAMAGISGGVGGGLGAANVGGAGWEGAAVRGALGSAISQGVGVAVGLQSKFSWTGVAAAGVGAGISEKLGGGLKPLYGEGAERSFNNIAAHTGVGAAQALANAATRSVLEGTSFGDNVLAALPDVIGSTIGQILAGRILDQPEVGDAVTVTASPQGANSGPAYSADGEQLKSLVSEQDRQKWRANNLSELEMRRAAETDPAKQASLDSKIAEMEAINDALTKQLVGKDVYVNQERYDPITGKMTMNKERYTIAGPNGPGGVGYATEVEAARDLVALSFAHSLAMGDNWERAGIIDIEQNGRYTYGNYATNRSILKIGFVPSKEIKIGNAKVAAKQPTVWDLRVGDSSTAIVHTHPLGLNDDKNFSSDDKKNFIRLTDIRKTQTTLSGESKLVLRHYLGGNDGSFGLHVHPAGEQSAGGCHFEAWRLF